MGLYLYLESTCSYFRKWVQIYLFLVRVRLPCSKVLGQSGPGTLESLSQKGRSQWPSQSSRHSRPGRVRCSLSTARSSDGGAAATAAHQGCRFGVWVNGKWTPL